MDVITLYRRTLENWASRAGGVTANQWADPTPCAEWSVRDLTNHVVGEDRWTVPLMRGATIEEVGSQLDGDLLGEDPAATARTSVDEAMAVVAETLPGGGQVHLSFGDTDMAEYIHQMAAEHLVHSWDLSIATGQDTKFDDDLVAEVAQWWAGREDLYRSAGAVGPKATDSGDPQTDLLAGFGRTAQWTP